MSLFDKLKNYITGGDVMVSLENPSIAMPGTPLACTVTAIAKADVESKGLYVDVDAVENVKVAETVGSVQIAQTSGSTALPGNRTQELSCSTYTNAFLIHPAFSLKQGETKQFTGSISLPRELQPTYVGRNARHTVYIRARIDAPGNDPDSGFVELRVGAET